MTKDASEKEGSGGAPVRLFETRDVAREAGLTPAAIRAEAVAGRLVPVAVTSRGGRLFDRRAVDTYLAQRAERRRISGGGEAA
jgi:hypothetical protein